MDKSEKKIILSFVAGMVVIFALVLWSAWYRAGLQSEVYRRQGIEITQWECFMGVTPAERTINIK